MWWSINREIGTGSLSGHEVTLAQAASTTSVFMCVMWPSTIGRGPPTTVCFTW